MNRNQLMTVGFAGLLVAVGAIAKAEDLATTVTDEQITQQVKQKLATDEPAAAARIMVMTHDGVVTLMGRALRPADIATAVHDADRTDGVVRVDNRLRRRRPLSAADCPCCRGGCSR
jgi:osmotically-inducible protein OsmY